MKRLIVFLSLAAVMGACCTPRNAAKKDANMLKSANDKVTEMQKSIGFTDSQAEQIREIEYSYLVKEIKARQEGTYSEEYRKELVNAKLVEIEKILPRNQYMMYYSIEHDLLRVPKNIQLEH